MVHHDSGVIVTTARAARCMNAANREDLCSDVNAAQSNDESVHFGHLLLLHLLLSVLTLFLEPVTSVTSVSVSAPPPPPSLRRLSMRASGEETS